MSVAHSATPFLRKVILLILVPFLAFLFYAGYSIRLAWQTTKFAERVLQRAEYLEETFRLITHLQRERSKSALSLTGAIPLAELEQQYLLTQPTLETFLSNTANASLSSALISPTNDLRPCLFEARKASRSRETFPLAYQQYNRLIEYLQDVQEFMAQAFQDVETARLFNNILLIEAAREHAGKLRVNFTRLLTAPPAAEDEAVYLLFVTHTAIRELLNVRALSLTSHGQSMLAEKRVSPEWRLVNEMIAQVSRDRTGFMAMNSDPTQFVQAITKVIDDLEKITAHENQQVRGIQLAILEHARRQRSQAVSLILVVVLFLAYLGYDYISGLIERNQAYGQLRETLQELSEARQQEVSIGWQIQQELLLGKVPSNISGGCMACKSVPSMGVDGDFIDFFPHDIHIVDFLFGDVMGKGIPAALVGAATKSHFQRAMSRLLVELQRHAWPSPEEVVAHVHERMAPGLLSVERFVSLHYGQFDFSVRTLKLVNCGHTEVLHYHRAERQHTLYEPLNAPLGIFEKETFTPQVISFSAGDVFVFYSDGITEARNSSGEFFGKQRLVQCVAESASSTHPLPEIVVNRLFDDLFSFAGTDQFRDDLTILVVEIT